MTANLWHFFSDALLFWLLQAGVVLLRYVRPCDWVAVRKSGRGAPVDKIGGQQQFSDSVLAPFLVGNLGS